MPVYMIVEVTIHDPEVYSEYVARIPEAVKKYDGRYIVRGGPVTPLTGDWTPERIIVLEFPSAERMWAWNASPEYAELAPLRMHSTTTRAILVEGYRGGDE
ncbi:MAG: DUF1330 domain-containing protein [Candidatus Krumholzibacteriia bacterium]